MRKKSEKNTVGKKVKQTKIIGSSALALSEHDDDFKPVVGAKGRKKNQKLSPGEKLLNLVVGSEPAPQMKNVEDTAKIEAPQALSREIAHNFETRMNSLPPWIAPIRGRINLKNGIPLLLGLSLLSSLAWPEEWLSWKLPTVISSEHKQVAVENANEPISMPEAISIKTQAPAPLPTKAQVQVVQPKPSKQKLQDVIAKEKKSTDRKAKPALAKKTAKIKAKDARVPKTQGAPKSTMKNKLKDPSKKSLAKVYQ